MAVHIGRHAWSLPDLTMREKAFIFIAADLCNHKPEAINDVRKLDGDFADFLKDQFEQRWNRANLTVRERALCTIVAKAWQAYRALDELTKNRD